MKLGGGKDADAVVLDTLEPFLEGVVQNATTKVAKLEERLEQLTADVTTPIEEVAKLEQCVRNLKEEYGRVTDELARAIDADRASGAGWPHKAAALGAALSKLPPGGKAIVFSQYQHAAIKHLLETGARVVDLTAQMGPAQLDAVMNDVAVAAPTERVVVMLNPEHYGRGLNMQYVDHIVVMHATGKETLQQWIGRGHRIGRTNNLTVDIILGEGEADDIVEEFGGAVANKKQMVDEDNEI